jgi:hypothetical protein
MLACFSPQKTTQPAQYKVVEKMLKKITFSISIIVETQHRKKPQRSIIMLWKGKYLCCAAYTDASNYLSLLSLLPDYR